jgi:pantoate--beta-alanine ligase
MEVFKRIGPLKAFLDDQRSRGSSVGLVPTMGALHQGHISLIEASRKNGDFTVCSLFVNPTQFNDPQDLKKYPRNLALDEAMLRNNGCKALFAPDVDEMYEQDHRLQFEFGEIGHVLEGKFRPGHFSGVALVVSKLFNIVRPAHAYFGCKDYQQFRIISLLNEEMKFGIKLHGMPTVREPDGLAMSSRNALLSPEERRQAPNLFRCLLKARKDLLSGIPWTEVRTHALANLAGVRLDYFELVSKTTLDGTPQKLGDCILLIAAHFGNVRLIDNLPISE